MTAHFYSFDSHHLALEHNVNLSFCISDSHSTPSRKVSSTTPLSLRCKFVEQRLEA